MRFDLGLFDSLFGKRERLDLPLADGSMKTVMVTKAWLEKQVRDEKIVPTEPGQVPLCVCGVDGSRVSSIVIGEAVSQADYEKFHDPDTGGIFMIEYHEKGEKLLRLVTKATWLRAKETLDKIG